MNHFILKTLQIKDPNIMIDPDCVEEIEVKDCLSLVYYGLLTYHPKGCPQCGCVNEKHSIVKNGTRISRITLPLFQACQLT